MKIFVEDKKITGEYDGRIDFDKFVLIIDVHNSDILTRDYNSMKIEMPDGRRYTICGCKRKLNIELFSFPYEFSYYIQGWHDIENEIIKEYALEFNEFQSMNFSKRVYINEKEWKIMIHNQPLLCPLYEDENYKIEYREYPTNINLKCTFEYQYNRIIYFHNIKEYKLDNLFLNVRKMENILGFLIREKVFLNKIVVYENEREHYEIVSNTMSKKKFPVDPYVVDFEILKKTIYRYYKDDKFSLVIDYFYEYIYNSQDYTVLFIQLCNCMEIIGNCKPFVDKIFFNIDKIRDEIAKYLVDNRMSKYNLEKTRKKMNTKKIRLREKLYYYLIIYRKKDSIKEDIIKYILKINNTRNYYVHGNNQENIFTLDELDMANYLLLHLLDYLLFVVLNDDNKCIEYIKNAESCIKVAEGHFEFCSVNEAEEDTIYTINTRDNAVVEVTKSVLDLDDSGMKILLKDEYNICKQRLKMKEIDYIKLKRALIPNQEKDRKEICLIINTSTMKNIYGNEIYSKLLPLLNKESVYSVLEGDYIDIINNELSQTSLKNMLIENLVEINELRWNTSNMIFLIYFNSLSAKQLNDIIDGLKIENWFVGYVDVSKQSYFKSYLDRILIHSFIKYKDTVITSHPEDYKDEDNYNCRGYSFEESGFKLISINELSYATYLSYKIESLFVDESDVLFSFNVMTNNPTNLSDLKLIIDDNKWINYLTNDSKKGVIVKSLGYSIDDKDRFIKEIKKRIDNSFIYNIRINENGIMFNVCVEHQTINDDTRKTTIALQYYDKSKEIRVVTIT